MEHSLFKCNCCDKAFKSEKALRAHKAYKKPSGLSRQKFSCIKCKKEFGINNRRVHESKCFDLADSPTWNKGKTKQSHPELAEQLAAGGKGFAKRLEAGAVHPLATYWQTPEKRKEKSEWRKQLHKDNPEAHPNRRLAGNRSKMSYPERLVFDLLTEHGIEFDHNKKLDKYFPDFVIGKQIIEVDGAAWHNAEYDEQRDARLAELGYKVERFVVGRNKDLVRRVTKFLTDANLIIAV